MSLEHQLEQLVAATVAQTEAINGLAEAVIA